MLHASLHPSNTSVFPFKTIYGAVRHKLGLQGHKWLLSRRRWRTSSGAHRVPAGGGGWWVGGGQEFPPDLMDSRDGAQVAHGGERGGSSGHALLSEQN